MASVVKGASKVRELLPGASLPPTHVLASIRKFPSLEPIRYETISTELLNVKFRKDILWGATVYESDCQREGSSNPPTKGTAGFSGHKLRPQKGSGKARLGDRASPMLGTVQALARTAPSDFSTEFLSKSYSLAYKIALSNAYKIGILNIVESPIDINLIPTQILYAGIKFWSFHSFGKKKVVLILQQGKDETVKLLTNGFKNASNGRIVFFTSDKVRVRDILSADSLIIEKDALLNTQWGSFYPGKRNK